MQDQRFAKRIRTRRDREWSQGIRRLIGEAVPTLRFSELSKPRWFADIAGARPLTELEVSGEANIS
jgi:hypothetical protein